MPHPAPSPTVSRVCPNLENTHTEHHAVVPTGRLISPVTPGAIPPVSHVPPPTTTAAAATTNTTTTTVTLPQTRPQPGIPTSHLPSPVSSVSTHVSPYAPPSVGGDASRATGIIPQENGQNQSPAPNQVALANSPPHRSVIATPNAANVQPASPLNGGPSSASMQSGLPQFMTSLILSINPSEDIWQKWKPAFDTLRAKVHKSSEIAQARAMLLIKAYELRDILYIVLHQMYCRRLYQKQELQLFQSPAAQQGLEVLRDLLTDNSDIPPRIMSNFCTFPENLEGQAYAEWYDKTYRILADLLPRLATQFKYLFDRVQKGYYHARKYPPLPIELGSDFQLCSPVLLKVIFVSTCRRIYPSSKIQALTTLFENDLLMTRPISENLRPLLLKSFRNIPMVPFGSHALLESQAPRQFGQPARRVISENSALHPRAGQLSSPTLPQNTTAANSPQDSPAQIAPTVMRHSPPLGRAGIPEVWQGHQNQQQHLGQTRPDYMQGPVCTPARAQNVPPQANNTAQQTRAIRLYTGQMIQNASAQTPRAPHVHQPRRHSFQQTTSNLNMPSPSYERPNENSLISQPQEVSSSQTPMTHSVPSFPQPRQSHHQSIPLLPAPGSRIPQMAQPNPSRLALHQVNLRDPIKKLVRWESNGFVDTELFTYSSGFVMPPKFMDSDELSFDWSFEMSQGDIGRTTRFKATTNGLQRTAYFQPGCLSLRLRAIALKNSDKDKVYDTWPTANTSWPSVFYIHVNGTELFVRRKAHNGKDLPLDITQHLKEGENTLSLHFLFEPDECKNFRYVFGIERMETDSFNNVRRLVNTLPVDETRQRIQKRLLPVADNDDIAVVSDSLTVDLIDPFMAQIYNVPARSAHCDHMECFDLDTFITTRKSESGPTPMNDNWQCPICKADARPMHLTIDEFLVNVRAELISSNQLENTAAIDIRADGSWAPKANEDEHSHPDKSPSSTVPAKRKASGPLDLAVSRTKNEQLSPIKPREHTVIEID